MKGVKSPSNRLSVAFLKALQGNNYLSPTGVEYCAAEVDSMLQFKLEESDRFDSVSAWSGIFEAEFTQSVSCKQVPKVPQPPEFWTIKRRFDPRFIEVSV